MMAKCWANVNDASPTVNLHPWVNISFLLGHVKSIRERRLWRCPNIVSVFVRVPSTDTHWTHDVVVTLIQRRNNVVCPVGTRECRLWRHRMLSEKVFPRHVQPILDNCVASVAVVGPTMNRRCIDVCCLVRREESGKSSAKLSRLLVCCRSGTIIPASATRRSSFQRNLVFFAGTVM